MHSLNVWALAFGLLLALAGCTQPSSSTDSTLAEDSGTTLAQARIDGHAEITVLYVPAQGFAYYDGGALTGVTVEVMQDFVRWVERFHGVQVTVNYQEDTDWSRFYQRIVDSEGGVFGLGNVTITEARKEALQFSPAYMNNVAVLITHNSIDDLDALSDIAEQFSHLTPLAFAGTLHETRIRRLRDRYQSGVSIARASTNDEIIERVSENTHYSYIDAYNYWRAKDQGVPIKHHSIADDAGETFGIIMPHSNDWTPLLNAFFAADGGYRNTYRYREVLERHLGEALTETLERARLEAEGS
ncbi:MAG: transporter substrate-binding domain-containing protein [Idiomarina sp.]|nr:transporter substrate-binding domain-containing protein [Idiomarina sp.]